jgi:hypothetical protein
MTEVARLKAVEEKERACAQLAAEVISTKKVNEGLKNELASMVQKL